MVVQKPSWVFMINKNISIILASFLGQNFIFIDIYNDS